MVTLYHGTDRLFDRFEDQFLASVADRASNGYLGVWCSYDLELAARFGKYVLLLDAQVSAYYDLPIDALSRWHREANLVDAASFYAERRQDFLLRGCNVLRIIEVDGRCEMCVVLDAPTSVCIKTKVEVLK